MADAKRTTSPSLLEELAEAKVADRRCGIVKIMERMDEAEAAMLLDTIDNPIVSASDIARILTSHGFRASDKMIWRHRNRGSGGCGCPK